MYFQMMGSDGKNIDLNANMKSVNAWPAAESLTIIFELNNLVTIIIGRERAS